MCVLQTSVQGVWVLCIPAVWRKQLFCALYWHDTEAQSGRFFEIAKWNAVPGVCRGLSSLQGVRLLAWSFAPLKDRWIIAQSTSWNSSISSELTADWSLQIFSTKLAALQCLQDAGTAPAVWLGPAELPLWEPAGASCWARSISGGAMKQAACCPHAPQCCRGETSFPELGKVTHLRQTWVFVVSCHC